tara:strand:- start:565 stop:813 length:249 start_codon:yes stop_codon:yes gene_type:complete
LREAKKTVAALQEKREIQIWALQSLVAEWSVRRETSSAVLLHLIFHYEASLSPLPPSRERATLVMEEASGTLARRPDSVGDL